MKKTLLLIVSPVLLLVLLFVFVPQHFASSTAHTTSEAAFAPKVKPLKDVATLPEANTEVYASLIDYAMSLRGTPYVWAGETPDGFDCSGFITHVYGKYDVALPHSSRMQAEEGINVPLEEARPGDLLIFTGTNPDVREPGHVGIVITAPEEDTVSFVHASSNGGVKVSQVEGTRYEIRFLEARRVL
ncbi:C40 family peptidase [Pontibacter mangrovi]|uniref:NlpC/P60 family protein n=1 Tax=Pontibacter mangrovi TaxID=2589816 RepID=A0A501W7W0_9BACT|nr:C40 family peptidase [Pontibacter mangrovi]TPE46023.1 NlpC/P60 family protein [Pontibacter mangrovi]